MNDEAIKFIDRITDQHLKTPESARILVDAIRSILTSAESKPMCRCVGGWPRAGYSHSLACPLFGTDHPEVAVAEDVTFYGGRFDRQTVGLPRTPNSVIVGGQRYEAIVDPDTSAFLGGYVYKPEQP